MKIAEWIYTYWVALLAILLTASVIIIVVYFVLQQQDLFISDGINITGDLI